jgi:hypothetical protein
MRFSSAVIALRTTDYHIAFDGNFYRVPYTLADAVVDARATPSTRSQAGASVGERRTPGCCREHLLELFTIPVLACSPVHVLVNDSPALSGRELAELVFRVLPPVSGRDSCICSDS